MGTIQTTQFARRPFYVDAVQVTKDNMKDVAIWCDGHIEEGVSKKGQRQIHFIKVRVQSPKYERQTQAHIGDWILYAPTGYKVYTNKTFKSNFETTGAHATINVEQAASQNETRVPSPADFAPKAVEA